MNLKTYQASTMGEALAEVKRDLGRDAVILQTRTFRKGRLLGLFGGRPVWEVTASSHVAVPRRVDDGKYVPDAAGDDASDTPLDQARPTGESRRTDEPTEPPDDLSRHVQDIRGMVESLMARHRDADAERGLGIALEQMRRELIDQDVADQVADELMGQVQLSLTGEQLIDVDLVREATRHAAAGRIRVAEPARAADGAKVVAVIGPTGVGKTTTIAKLAADCKLRRGLRVGLITIDTYRIAAVDQLRTYADIIEVPLEAVLTPGELHNAVRSMRREVDVVLIDTAGRSQNDQMKLKQLRKFIEAAGADEVHLALSAAASRKVVAAAAERFAPLGADRYIVTKLDEAESYGMILNLSLAGATISYVTTGQDVPDDIAPADAEWLAERIVGGGRYES